MSADESSINLNLNSTKTGARPSHEALESQAGNEEKTEQEKIDQVAMESAKRSQNRIHNDEQRNPEDTMFTK